MEPVDQRSPEVPLEVYEFVEELMKNAEAIEIKNTDLKKQINSLKKKCLKMQECENLNRKRKVEMLKLFKRYLEDRKNKSSNLCKKCPPLHADLQTVKKRISELLEEQTDAQARLGDIERAIKLKKVIEERKIHENKEFNQQCIKRKADESKHFFRSKFEAYWLRNEIKQDLGPEENEEYVRALQMEVTEIVTKKAFDEIPEKIIDLEREAYFEALEEVRKKIAEKDKIVPKKLERGFDRENSSDEEYDSESSYDELTEEEEKLMWEAYLCSPVNMDDFYEQAEKQRRLRSMEQIYKPKTHI